MPEHFVYSGHISDIPENFIGSKDSAVWVGGSNA